MSDDLLADLSLASPDYARWQKTQTLGEQQVLFVMEPEDQAPRKEDVDAVAIFWTDLPSFDARARMFLSEDSLENGSATLGYIEHHLEGLRFEVLEELFGDTDDLDAQTVVLALLLVRVALAPTQRSAVFYYSLGQEITDYVLAVSVSADGQSWSAEVASYDPSGD